MLCVPSIAIFLTWFTVIYSQLANIYDVPWDTASTDLGLDPADKGADEKQAEVAAPSEKMDANAAYERATALLSAKLPKEKERMDPATQQGSYFETFRKNVSRHDLD